MKKTQFLAIAFLCCLNIVALAGAGPPPPPPVQIPIDGGLSIIVGSGIAYLLRKKAKNKNH